MRKHYFKGLVFILLSSILITSCQNEIASEDNIRTNNSLHVNENDPLVSKILKMGFELKNIEEFKDYYLVEGDIVFDKSDMNIMGKTKQYYADFLVDMNVVNNITVRIDNSIPVSGVDDWRSAVSSAIAYWNNIPGSRINFILTTNATADITILSDNSRLGDYVIAAGKIPSNNYPGRTIEINLDYLSNISVLEGQKSYNMVHELGHCIGFIHTNWIKLADITYLYGANLIPFTFNDDSNSVMNGGTATYSFTGFSTWDNYSARYLYPEHNTNLVILKPYVNEHVVTGQSSFDIYWKSKLINEANVKIEIFSEGLLTTSFVTPNNGYCSQAFSPDSNTTVKISSISDPNIYDEIIFYHQID